MDQHNTEIKQIEKLTPLDSSDRLHHIDSLRGFALLGILLVNMLAFQYGTVGYKFILPNLSTPDKATFSLIEWLLQGSFYPIFSIIFGFGAVMMWERAQAKSKRFKRVFLRRLLILLAIGCLHLYLIWDGDILVTYAIAGLIFLFFIKRKPKTLLIWALVLVFFINGPGIVEESSKDQLDLSPYVEYENNVLAKGSYLEIVYHRLTVNPFEKVDFGENLDPLEQEFFAAFLSFFSFATIVAQAVMLFLLGGYLAKKRWLHDTPTNKRILTKMVLIFLPVGVGLKGGMVFTENALLDYYGYLLGGPIAALGYIAGFILLFAKFGSTLLFQSFAYLGRMALTNYLTQSIVMTTIFYGYGLGMFSKLGISIGILFALLLIIAQVIFSRWWLKRYTFGPLEWLWRTGTYLRRQPLRQQS